jgi:hypothetical protein
MCGFYPVAVFIYLVILLNNISVSDKTSGSTGFPVAVEK